MTRSKNRAADTMYEVFGRIAEHVHEPTLVAGRRGAQRFGEAHIVADVVAKLQVQATDDVLDIGCGLGTLSGSLAAIAASVVGVDHPSIVRQAAQLVRLPNVSFREGTWFEAEVALGRFDRIVAYSVIQYLASYDEVLEFALKAVNHLKPGGRLLLADIPNRDRAARFAASASGRKFNEAYAQMRAAMADVDETARDQVIASAERRKDVDIGDQLVLALLRDLRVNGAEAFLLPQPHYLPFGMTREDILVMAPQ